MRLVCQKAFLLAFVVALACHDTSAPPPFPADFVLDNINGRALPTFVSPIPEGLTIVSSTLHFDGSGKVVLTEHGNVNQADFTVTYNLDYRITGTRIEIGCLRDYPQIMLCVANYVGVISENALSLTPAPNDPVIYNYKILTRAVGL